MDAQLDAMNYRWSVLDEDGQLSVVRFVEDAAQRRRNLVRYSFSDFRRKLETHIHEASGKPLGDAWLAWSGRKQYDRVVFKPREKTPSDVLNLWQDFGVPPREGGSCERIEHHLVHIVCGGNSELYNYLFKWMARLAQFPGKQGEVAVVLRGKEGVGKSVVGKLLRRIFGQHALAVSSPKYVIGDFNSHLADVVFLECSEALFAGDRQGASKLKALITDDTLIIERKGADAVQWPNSLTVLMTSNEDWVVPAGPESRRFFVLDVLDKHRGDTAYFDALHAEVEDDACVGAFLSKLLATDISGFKHRDFPVTEALRDQRERSLSGVLAWGLDLASRGSVRTDKGLAWRSFFTTRELFEDFSEWVRARPFERAVSVNTFGRDLRNVLGLQHQRRATTAQDVPEASRGCPGFCVPGTAEGFEQLVRSKAGLQSDEPCNSPTLN